MPHIPRNKPRTVEKFNYPWSYDKDVIETGKSIDTAEASTGKLLTY